MLTLRSLKLIEVGRVLYLVIPYFIVDDHVVTALDAADVRRLTYNFVTLPAAEGDVVGQTPFDSTVLLLDVAIPTIPLLNFFYLITVHIER